MNNTISALQAQYMLVYLYVLYLSKGLTCVVEEALVSGNNPIPDAQITASSEYNDFHGPRYSRINNTAGGQAWLCSTAEMTAPEPRMYLQVCSPVAVKEFCYYAC